MKSFDRVLVRVTPEWEWMPHIFSKEVGDVYFTIDGRCWQYCIPYEGNEHLLGNTGSPMAPELEFAVGSKVEVSDDLITWHKAIYCCKTKGDRGFPHTALRQDFMQTEEWKFCRKSDW